MQPDMAAAAPPLRIAEAHMQHDAAAVDGAGAAAQPAEPAKKAAGGKLTDLHGEPPVTIKRNENGYLSRGKMLGEGGFARVYTASDSLTGTAKAVKVISKEQLKSSKTKAKVGKEHSSSSLHLYD